MHTLARMAGALALVASGANAQLIVGNDQSGTASIYHVDVGTGVATAIYTSSTSEAKPWGMAYDRDTNTLYWNNGSNLYSSPFSMSLTPQLLGTMTFNAATVNFVGLGFRDGMLLGTRNIATEAVYAINPGTLVATQQYVYPSTFDFGGVDVDAATGLLYGLSDTGGTGLYEIDVDNATQVLRAPYPAGQTDIDGLAVDNGRAYYVTDGPISAQPFFYIYDVASGLPLGTLASPFTGSGTFSAAAFIPAPGGAAILSIACFGALRRRR
jgi:hypothetical protein